MIKISKETVALLEDWSKALKSGNYKQAQGVLEDPDGKYCCLGVVAKRNQGRLKNKLNLCEFGNTTELLQQLKENGLVIKENFRVIDKFLKRPIPGKLKALLENHINTLLNDDCSYDIEHEFSFSTMFISLNDDYNFTFKQIAEVIDFIISKARITK